MRHFLLRGILIGGSMGVLYALAGFSDSLPRAFGVGMIGGALAGLTLAIRQRKRKDRVQYRGQAPLDQHVLSGLDVRHALHALDAPDLPVSYP